MLRRVPWAGILGCIIGCCITFAVKLLLFPASSRWPYFFENHSSYVDVLTKHYGYTRDVSRYQVFIAETQRNKSFLGEADFLKEHARILCYTSDQDMKDAKHFETVLKTWPRHCDKAIAFNSLYKLSPNVKKEIENYSNIQLVPMEKSQSTMKVALEVLSQYGDSFDWIVYVPAYVFIIPNNMRYALYSSGIDPKAVHFIGKPNIYKITGGWSVSDRSPLIISSGALRKAADPAHMHPYCSRDGPHDPGCLLQSTDSEIYNIKDENFNEIIVELQFSTLFIRYTYPEVVGSLKSRYPISIYIQDVKYKTMLEIEYYIHHLGAYGKDARKGSMVKLQQSPNNISTK